MKENEQGKSERRRKGEKGRGRRNEGGEKGERRRKGLVSVTQMIPAPGEGARMGLDMTR